MQETIAPQMVNYVASLPQNYVGDLYATLELPGWWIFKIRKEVKVPVWGQVADGRPHEDAVGGMLGNYWPRHGKGVRYISWRNVPASPELNDAPRTGKITNLKPFHGDRTNYRCFRWDRIDPSKDAMGTPFTEMNAIDAFFAGANNR